MRGTLHAATRPQRGRRTNTPQVTPAVAPTNTEEPKALAEHADLPATGTGLPRGDSKLGVLIAALRRTEGATIAELTLATSWQAHSVRGAISGNLKKKLKLDVVSDVVEGRGRVYRISDVEAAQ